MSGWVVQLADPIALGLVTLAGVLLLFLGARLLRPAIVLAAVVVSASVGLRLAVLELDGGLVGVPPWVWIVVLPLVGCVLAVLLYRLCLALLFAFAAASAGFLIAVVITIGPVLPGDPSSLPASQESSEESTSASFGGVDGDSVMDPIMEFALSATESEDSEILKAGIAEVARELSRRIDMGLYAASGWLSARSVGLGSSQGLLALGIAMVSGLVGFAVGLRAPEYVARGTTSVVGAWLLVIALSGFIAYSGPQVPGLTPFAVFVTWGVLAVVGGLVQSRFRPRRADSHS